MLRYRIHGNHGLALRLGQVWVRKSGFLSSSM
jgi:hypothetical protein